MATFKAKKFREALKKAKNVGRVEEAVTIDGCNIVLQSLTSDMHEAIFAELDGDVQVYNMGFQIAMLSRAIVEIEGLDLRNADVIEEEAPPNYYQVSVLLANEAKALDLKKVLAEQGLDVSLVSLEGTEEKTFLLERPEWIKRQLSTWSREAVLTGYKKCLDVIAKGEIQSSQEVKFTFTGETDEEKYRRLLSEMKALEETLPTELVSNVLNDAGYLQKNSTKELEEAISKLEVEPPRVVEAAQPVKQSELVIKSEPPAPIPIPTQIPPQVSNMMADRVPMNQESLVPTQLKQTPQPGSRAAQIAALESGTLEEIKRNAHRPQEVGTLTQPLEKIQEDAVVIDQPTFGLNPKFYRRNQ